MSVNLDLQTIEQRISDHARPGEAAVARTPVRHLLIFFGGWQDPGEGRLQMLPGHEITQIDRKYDTERSSYTAFRLIRGHFGSPSTSYAMDPALRADLDNEAVKKGIEVLSRGFDPRGRLVVYGFSAGGFNALRFAERILRDTGWYDFQTRSLTDQPEQISTAPERFARVKVDLLVTIDPCISKIDPDNHERCGAVKPPAARQINYYQNRDVENGIGRRVEPGTDQAAQWVGASNHDRMPWVTIGPVQRHIEDCFDAPLSRLRGGGWDAVPRVSR